MHLHSVSKKSFRHAVCGFSNFKKFEKPVLLNVQEVLTPCTHSPLLSRQTLVMTIGLSKQQQIFCKCPKNAVIASQCAHWRGNPFPFTRVVFTETLRKSQRLGCGLPRRFAPRNDSAGRNPVIKIHMFIKTDSYIFHYTSLCQESQEQPQSPPGWRLTGFAEIQQKRGKIMKTPHRMQEGKTKRGDREQWTGRASGTAVEVYLSHGHLYLFFLSAL